MTATLELLSARAVLDAQMSEAQFRHAVTKLMTRTGWRWSYLPDSRKVQGFPGIPDVLAVRRQRLLFVELKKVGGALSEEQWHWAVALECTGGATEVYQWWPRDWRTIERVLA